MQIKKTLINWIDRFKTKPKKIFIVHGEEEQSNTLSNLIEDKFNIETIVPNMEDKFNISKDEIELKKGINIEPVLLQQDIENELENVYKQFGALVSRSGMLYKDKIIEKKL